MKIWAIDAFQDFDWLHFLVKAKTQEQAKDIVLEDKVRRCWKINTSDIDPVYVDNFQEYVKLYKEKFGIYLDALGVKR